MATNFKKGDYKINDVEVLYIATESDRDQTHIREVLGEELDLDLYKGRLVMAYPIEVVQAHKEFLAFVVYPSGFTYKGQEHQLR